MAPELALAFERRFTAGPVIDVDLRCAMPPGSILVLFGPSGSGKTTIVRCLAGLDRPQRGTIRFGAETWLDTGVGAFSPPQTRGIGYVFQHPVLFPHLTVRGNVAYGLHGQPAAERDARVDEMLTLLGVADLAARRPRELSGGQAQRVALARALAPRPPLLLLDEPFAALDAPLRASLRATLRSSMHHAGAAAVLVTHDRQEAIALGDHLAVVADGRVHQVGPVLEVFRRPANLTVARSVGVEAVIPARVLAVGSGIVDLGVAGAVLHAADVRASSREALGLAALAAGDEVFACIRAEDVALERTPVARASARNHLPGRIAAVEHDGALERVTIDCGVLLTSLITRHAREELALAVGDGVTAAIKATAIHIVPRA